MTSPRTAFECHAAVALAAGRTERKDEVSDLNVALNRAYHAWVRTQPQLILELWGDRGLDETETGALRLVEPACYPDTPPRAGSTNGAEPYRGPSEGTTAALPATVAHARTWASAPSLHNGPGRIAPEAQRGQGQEGA